MVMEGSTMASIVKRGNGYRIAVSCGYGTDGRKVVKTMSWTPEPNMTAKQISKEVERQAVLFEESIKTGHFIASNVKFAAFAEQWMNDYAEKQLAPATVDSYRFYLKRTNAAIGNIRLDRLRPNHIIEFYNNLEENGVREDIKYSASIDLAALLKSQKLTRPDFAKITGLSVRTVDCAIHGKNVSRDTAEKVCKALKLKLKEAFKASGKSTWAGNSISHYHRFISSVLTTAVQRQIIVSNPAERVKPPKIEHNEAVYLDAEQAKHLIELLDSEPVQYRVMITLLLYSGMRRGELCGLEWKDIDFEHSILSVCRSSQYLPSKGIFTKEPKNKSSIRALQLPDVAFNLLRAYKAWQTSERLKIGDQWVDTDRLFTKWNGKPIHPDTLTGWFHKFIKKTDFPEIHIHSLRHTNATLLIAEGVNVRLVADMLGHSKPTTTLNIYSHAIKSAQAAASQRVGDILSGAKKQPAAAE
jgi:integrase